MILVVGGAGYIGSHMCKLLREAGEPHLVFDNLSQGHRAAVQESILLEGDLRSRADLDKVFQEERIDLVMHFAAFISVGESVREPAKYWDNNTMGVYTLLEAMRAHGIKQFVFSSTAAIFGEPAAADRLCLVAGDQTTRRGQIRLQGSTRRPPVHTCSTWVAQPTPASSGIAP